MAWNPGTVQTLIDLQQYRLGAVGMEAIRSVIDAAKQWQPGVEQPSPAITSAADVDDSPTIVLRSSPGRLYWLRIENLTAAAINAVFTITADTIVVGGGYVPARISASVPSVLEIAFFGSPNGVGMAITTDLRVRAFTASDGTTGAAAGVTIYALTSA
jgi:hypothetical protein